MTSTYRKIEDVALEHKHGETDTELIGYSRVAGITLYTAESRLYNFATQTLRPQLRPPISRVYKD